MDKMGFKKMVNIGKKWVDMGKLTGMVLSAYSCCLWGSLFATAPNTG